MTKPHVLVLASSLALTGLLTLASCGSDSTTTPVTPSPATPTPAPVPTPSAGPAAFSCPLPPSSNESDNCFVGKSVLAGEVNDAINIVIATRPELFNLEDMNGGNPHVRDRDGYWKAVKVELEKQGICTIIQKEELAIKNHNAFNEQWNIQSTAGYVRRRYVTSCTPAWF